ncbi:MAG: phosphatase PAP2 family protein, partial [Patescibacteria group bacterium]
ILSQYSVTMMITVTIITLGVAWARVVKKVHRPIDVIVGIVLGKIIAFIAMVLMARIPNWL